MVKKIPTTLLIVTRSPTKISNDEVVLPAFIVDAENDRTSATARSWATHWRNTAGPEFTQPNDPKAGYRIVNIEHRDEGGRAYKIVSPEGFYFDFREPAMMDVIRHAGIQAGGTLNGKYLFVRTGSTLNLVREGSKQHLDALGV